MRAPSSASNRESGSRPQPLQNSRPSLVLSALARDRWPAWLECLNKTQTKTGAKSISAVSSSVCSCSSSSRSSSISVRRNVVCSSSSSSSILLLMGDFYLFHFNVTSTSTSTSTSWWWVSLRVGASSLASSLTTKIKKYIHD